MNDLSTLVTGENAALIGAIVVIISTAKAVVPNLFLKPLAKRLLPLVPIVLGIAAVFLGFGEAGDALDTWQDDLVLGCLLGFTAGQMYKAGKTSLFGKTVALEGTISPADADADQVEGD